jgi:DNA-binding CsgD family transcriptional regulator
LDLAKGETLAQIAATLGIAYKTVSNTCVRLRDKMGVRSTIELVTALKRLDLA